MEGVATDPTTVTLTVKRPDNVLDIFTTGQLTHTSTGTYSYVYHPPVAGRYYYGFVGTGTVEAAFETEFYLEPTILT